MSNRENSRAPEKIALIKGESFNFVLERRNGIGLYVNADRSKYLRLGSRAVFEKEIGFHKRLLAGQFPVARILDEGEIGRELYWIEESLGAVHLTDQFYADVQASGQIAEGSFEIFLRHAVSMRDAEARMCALSSYDFAHLAQAVGKTGMAEELPEFAERIGEAWEKAKQRIQNLPVCLTHGDFNSTNIMERGVIDFGDHFDGPLGYDMVNAITTPLWFPKEAGYEYFRKYDFTERQIERFFAECGVSSTPYGNFNLKDSFDALFFLKANWWSVRNHKMPKLQAWRYYIYREIVEHYITGASLYDYWRKNGVRS